jgi:glycosyltransferase involved in cell wall biosynthesis
MHAVEDVNKPDFQSSLSWIQDTLKKVDNIFVHNISDLNILKSFDLINNVTLFPHGVAKRKSNENIINNMKTELRILNKKVIASYGFLLPHKGIKELIEAFAILKQQKNNLHLLLVNAIYPAPISNEYLNICQECIKNLNLEKDVTMINDFLNDEESFSYIDCADLLVMSYRRTQESASGAVRYAVSTNKPVLCTPLNIFNDVEDIVYFSKDTSISALIEGILSFIEDETYHIKNKKYIQQKWIDEHDWYILGKRLGGILQ